MIKGLNLPSGSLKKVLIAAGVAAVMVMSTGRAYADPFPVFTFDPSIFGGIPGDQSSDRISGTYYENLVIGAGNTWTASGYVLFEVMQNANDVAIPGDVSGLGFGEEYILYALYTASGTFTTPLPGLVVFNVATATGQLLADDPINNTYDTNPAGGYANPASPDVDDLLALGIFQSGSGVALGGPVPTGSFSINYDPRLTNFLGQPVCSGDGVSGGTGPGCSFFTSPHPFYLTANLSGQFIEPNILGAQTVTGTADLIFSGTPVPEPGTLGLLGIGLLGVARRLRGKKQAA
jgi:PEP-CTERM motif-containing protein